MKTSKLLLLTILISSMLAIACTSEEEPDIVVPPTQNECETNNATLSGAIQAIINTNCAVPSCHVTGTARVDFTVKQNIIQYASQISSYTQSGFMPYAGSGLSLTAAEKKNILCWVTNGAKDN